MAISTYAELQTAVANWVNRSDLTDRIPEFIALAEAQINSDMDLRTTESDQALTAVVGVRTIALPAAYREPVGLWLAVGSESREELPYLQPQLLDVTTTNARPSFWTVDGTNIAFDCPSDAAYAVTFRMKGGVALSGSATTNLILTNYPHLYLFGAIKEFAVYDRDADLMQLAEGKYQAALEQARHKEGRAKALATLRADTGMLARSRRYDIYRDH